NGRRPPPCHLNNRRDLRRPRLSGSGDFSPKNLRKTRASLSARFLGTVTGWADRLDPGLRPYARKVWLNRKKGHPPTTGWSREDGPGREPHTLRRPEGPRSVPAQMMPVPRPNPAPPRPVVPRPVVPTTEVPEPVVPRPVVPRPVVPVNGVVPVPVMV